MNTKKKVSRFNLIIYPGFQLTILSLNFGLVLTAAGYIGLNARIVFSNMKGIGQQMRLPASSAFYRQIDLQAHTFYNHLFLGLLAALVFSSIVTLILSHRMAGPILRLKSYLEQITRSNTAPERPLSFRRGDFFNDLAPSLNNAVMTLKNHEIQEEQDDEVTQKIKLCS